MLELIGDELLPSIRWCKCVCTVNIYSNTKRELLYEVQADPRYKYRKSVTGEKVGVSRKRVKA